ncbi:MAG: hypothetical protein F4232_10810 [Acidimicrobiaceae bacterium]|nr:hypothetical protein [Acidimicrobiaceae bacterium]
MTSWEHDPFAFEEDPLSSTDSERSPEDSPRVKAGGRATGRRSVLLLAAASIAAVVGAIWLGESGGAWGAVVLGGLAYLLAVAVDLRIRVIRRLRRRYDRPWLTALLRLAVFWAAVGAAWLAASGLAAA